MAILQRTAVLGVGMACFAIVIIRFLGKAYFAIWPTRNLADRVVFVGDRPRSPRFEPRANGPRWRLVQWSTRNVRA